MAIGSPAPTAQPGQLVDIGTVAAANIVRALDLPVEKTLVVRNAIRDEISALSSHFTMAISDVQTNYELDLAKVKAEWSFVKNNKALVIGALTFAVLWGALVARLV